MPSRDSSPHAADTSIKLLDRVKRRDPDAWKSLVELYAPLVYRLCRVANVAARDAADVVQEVFRAVARKIESFHRDQPGDSFRGWLLVITNNKIRDHFRTQARNPAVPVGGSDLQVQLQQLPDLTWESSTDGRRFDSRSELMRRAMRLVRGDFADKTWQAFWQATIENQPTHVVAEGLGMSTASVYQARSRVLSRIRQELQGLVD